MALGPLIFFAVLALVHHPLLVNEHTDLATLERLQKQEKVLQKEMGHLQKELEQKSWNWDPSRSREDVVTPDLATEDGTWDGWHYVALVILILFGCCRQTMEKEPSYDSSTDSASTTTTEELDDTDQESDHSETKEKMLDAFYHKHIQAETGDLGSLCDFVEAFVNDLVDACRGALPYQNTLPLLENCIGVGSAFEGWHVQKGCQAFSVLVPMVPPKGHFFSIETNDSEEVLSKHGHILVETECMCKRERLLGDVVCFLHHPQQELSQDMQGAYIMPVLCTSSHLDVDKTIHWFQKLVGKAWRSISPKFNLTLTPQASRTTCRLKLAFRSGRSIFIDIILGVQQGDSLVFLSSHGTETDNSTGTIWVKTFAVQELLFFKWVSQRMPEDSCHLKCLQLIIYFRESNSSSTHPTVLLNYHYKTCLMHLLLLRPLSEWGPENLASRLQDVLLFMNTALQEKYLEHFLIGNISLPIQIPVPKALRSADPINLFAHLAQDPKLHAKAKKEFEVVVEQVRNLFLEHEE